VSGLDEKERGEILAEVALDSGVPIAQLRKLYDAARSMSVDDLEVFVKYQMTRISGYWDFGGEVLSILDEYGRDKEALLRILEKAIMLYDYLDVKRFMDLKPKISEVVRRVSGRYGFEGVDLSFEDGEKRVTVILSRFHGSPQRYASEIYHHIVRSLPEASKHKFRVWIKGR